MTSPRWPAGQPRRSFLSRCPIRVASNLARQVHQGIIDLADQFDVVIAGGDTNSWNGPLVISVTVTGQPLGPQPVRRDGARAGDWLFVTGELGGSLPSGRHLSFLPRLNEADRLAKLVKLHAMIDISDGLAADLHHVLKASRVGAILQASEIPLSQAAVKSTDGRSALMHGLSDGEDFELLFAVAPDDGDRLISQWHEATSLTKIGEITAEQGCWLRGADDRLQPLAPLGWTHQLGRGP